MIPVFFIGLTLLVGCSIIPSAHYQQVILKDKPKHHTETGFQNYPFVQTRAAKSVFFYLRRLWHSFFIPDVPDGHVLSENEASKMLNSIEGDSITWLGHASFLIKLSNKIILTDPFLSEFASPISWAGPRRFVTHAIPFEKLPPIDIILVSHNHYDHLDDETVSQLTNKQKIQVVVPLGLKSFFTERGYNNVTEIDWQESTSNGDIEFTALPAVHDSARSTSDHNQTLWASWSIRSTNNSLFFVGDSGYSESIYSNVGKQFISFDYAILPIGAYEPRELMWMSHTTPEEAVAIGDDVHAKTLIASHWGTVSSLSDEPLWEPPKRFLAAGLAKNYTKESLWMMKIGETRPLLVKRLVE